MIQALKNVAFFVAVCVADAVDCAKYSCYLCDGLAQSVELVHLSWGQLADAEGHHACRAMDHGLDEGAHADLSDHGMGDVRHLLRVQYPQDRLR